MTEERDRLTSAGLYVVGGAAAVMSFTALADLAWLLGVRAEIPLPWVGVPPLRVAWLLPLAVDVFAFTASRVWLQGRTNAEALAVAQRAAWAAIGTTVLGNGAHGYLVSVGTGQPWWWSVVVSAIPALALGALVHLAHLVGRGPDTPPAPRPAADPWLVLLDEVLAEPWDGPVTRWVAAGGGAEQQVPTSEDDDVVLVADLRGVVSAQGRPLSVDKVRERYGIGWRRATRIVGIAQGADALNAVPEEASA